MLFGLRLKHGEYLSRFEVRNAIYSFCPLPYYEHVCSDFVNFVLSKSLDKISNVKLNL